MKEEVRYVFTPQEIVALGDLLARETRSLTEAKRAKAAAAAAHGAAVKDLEQRVDDVSQKIVTGFEYRSVECEVQFNTPKNGIKRIVRVDNGETVRDAPMSEAEKQDELPFVAEDDRPKRGKK